MAREVLVDADGLATGVSYIDKKTRKEVQVRGKIVVLAASACETARLLLNSTQPDSSQRPRQFHRPGGQISDGYGGHRRRRISPRSDGPAPA